MLQAPDALVARLSKTWIWKNAGTPAGRSANVTFTGFTKPAKFTSAIVVVARNVSEPAVAPPYSAATNDGEPASAAMVDPGPVYALLPASGKPPTVLPRS